MAAPTGLRERKKQQTRDVIAAAAMQLFGERGFDAVTVAEVAVAAGVSEKTVFNYFPAKEDLVFPDGEARWAALLDSIRDRPEGASVVAPFRAATREFLDQVANGDVEEIVARPRLVMASSALRGRLFVWWEQEATLLAPVIARAAGDRDGTIVSAVVARTLAWTHRITFRAAFTRLLAGEDQKRVARDLRKQADEAYDLLEAGLRDYGRA
ncbi:MAG TPA: TetR family transcriptional regulator [Thermoleophilaceae bacterium]|jgi:AcrR family transcriptional regulator|nr:TetR family transcriptional regulator [Thermoleophilaceae bacterium]